MARPPTARSGRGGKEAIGVAKVCTGTARSGSFLHWGILAPGQGGRKGTGLYLMGYDSLEQEQTFNTCLQKIISSETDEVYIPMWTKTAHCPHSPYSLHTASTLPF